MKRLSTTSFAVLGLLALRPWTTYELAHEMERSLRYVWPRSESGLYEEPKALVERGLARAKYDMVGRRPRTTYSITAKGRRAMAEWLKGSEDAYPRMESPALLRVLFAEQGTKADLLATLAAIREAAEERYELMTTVAHDIAVARSPFPLPKRAHVNYLFLAFLVEQATATLRWARAAEREVRTWPDDISEASGRRHSGKLRKLV